MCLCGGERESVNLIVDVRLSSLIHHTNVWGRRPAAAEAAPHLLVDGLEKLALVFPHLGVVDLLHQLRVFVDEPCFPEYIGGCVLYLRGDGGVTAELSNVWMCVTDAFLFLYVSILAPANPSEQAAASRKPNLGWFPKASRLR